MKLKPIHALCLPWLLAARALHAGASLYVDDAGTTPEGHCQVESWTRVHAPGQEWSMLPACTRRGVEYSLGVNRFGRAGETLFTRGIKHTLRDPEGQAWGVALSFGAAWNARRGRLDGWSANLPVTLVLDAQGQTRLHVNVGWNKPRGAHGTPTGGLGLQRRLGGRWSLLAETYADGHGDPAWQLGTRASFGEAVSVDLLLGCTPDRQHGRWFTLGLNVALPD
ncbi:MAG: hypothetical protein OJI74_04910 [Rhodanobacter thiooxydans]|nr:hypothetical protein [Rhodanobacter thiooxydans]